MGRCFVHNTFFQLIASLGKRSRNPHRNSISGDVSDRLLVITALPAFIIHTGVHQAQVAFKKMGRYTKWGPTVVGLAMIPFLPPLVDYPAEVIIDTGFAYAWPHPVRHPPARHRC